MTPEVAGRLIEIAGPIRTTSSARLCAYEEADGAIGNDEVNQGMEEALPQRCTYADLFSGARPASAGSCGPWLLSPYGDLLGPFRREVQLANAASVRKAVDAWRHGVRRRDGDAWKVADPFFRYGSLDLRGTACDD